MNKTYSAKPHEVEQKWYGIDAADKTFGRLASLVANILRGKLKPEYTSHVDTGDFVIVTNIDKIKITGKKETDKMYYSHSGYPGGFKTVNYKNMVQKHPIRAFEKAVRGMLPHNTLGRKQFKKLKVYPGSEHPHEAQIPVEWKEIKYSEGN